MKREMLLSLGILFCVSGFAQNIKIIDSKVRESKDSVTVTFKLRMGKIKSNERLTVTPILYNGNNSMPIHRIMATGRNRDISDQRYGIALKPVGKAKKGDVIEYRSIVPYQSWMSDVSLRIESKIENCCTEHVLASQYVITNKPIRYDVIVPEIEILKPEFSSLEKLDIETPFLAPMSEYIAMKDNFDAMRVDGALIVRFGQGNNTVSSSYQDNAKSLKQVHTVLELIDSDPNVSVGKIVLVGTSSPEGSAQLNEKLAQQRVQALRNYLKEHTGVNINLVDCMTVGEDWIGLREMVEKSGMQYKDEVLAIIDNVPVKQGREKQLMDLKWGRPYNYMMEHFFPKLRNAGYIRIFYDAKPDEEFTETNQAINLVNGKEYRDALTRLDGTKQTATTEYIRGVCHMMLGEYDLAEASLNSAIKLGNTQATESLDQLTKLKAVKH